MKNIQNTQCIPNAKHTNYVILKIYTEQTIYTTTTNQTPKNSPKQRNKVKYQNIPNTN